MIRISTSSAYRLGHALAQFKGDFSRSPRVEIQANLTNAQGLVRSFILDTEFGSQMKATKPVAQKFDAFADEVMEEEDQTAPVGRDAVKRFHELFDRLETVLLSELDVAATYLVTNKKGWMADTLIMDGEVIFADGIAERCPRAIPDLRNAAQCIAFEMPTSAGFHLHRAHEIVIIALLHELTGGTYVIEPKNRSLGTYIRVLERTGKVDPKIIANLRAIKDLHRNTVMHPEESLSNAQATSLLGIIDSSISSMLQFLPIDAPRLTAPVPGSPVA